MGCEGNRLWCVAKAERQNTLSISLYNETSLTCPPGSGWGKKNTLHTYTVVYIYLVSLIHFILKTFFYFSPFSKRQTLIFTTLSRVQK